MQTFVVTWINDYGMTFQDEIMATDEAGARECVWQDNQLCLSILSVVPK